MNNLYAATDGDYIGDCDTIFIEYFTRWKGIELNQYARMKIVYQKQFVVCIFVIDKIYYVNFILGAVFFNGASFLETVVLPIDQSTKITAECVFLTRILKRNSFPISFYSIWFLTIFHLFPSDPIQLKSFHIVGKF